MSGAPPATAATMMTANTSASLSQGAYRCMRTKNVFTMFTPFLLAFRFCGLPLLLNSKGVGLTKLLPRIEVGKISENAFYTEGRMVALALR